MSTCSRRRVPAALAVTANLQAHNAYLKIPLLCHLLLELFKSGTRVFHNGSTAKTCHMAMVTAGFRLVVVLLSFEVHQVQLVDQSTILEQCDRSIDGGAVDARIPLPGDLKQLGRIEMTG